MFSAQSSFCLLAFYLLLRVVFLWLTICIWFGMRWQYDAYINLNLDDAARAFIFYFNRGCYRENSFV